MFTNFGSDIFTFRVGPAVTEFSVHADAIARLSGPLDKLINSDFLEKKEKTIIWDHVSVETFESFCEYAYHGDYYSPAPVESTKPPSTPAPGHKPEDVPSSVPKEEGSDAITEANRLESLSLRLYQGDRVVQGAAAIKAAFEKREYAIERPAETFARGCKTRPNSADESLEHVLLSHARVYVLAVEKMVRGLQTLCLHKMHAILAGFTVNAETILDVISLARFTFAQTMEGDAMRLLLAEFFCWKITVADLGGAQAVFGLAGRLWRVCEAVLAVGVLAEAGGMTRGFEE